MFRVQHLFLAIFVLVSKMAVAAPPIDLGSRLELFIDAFLIDSLADTELRLATPHNAGPVLRFDAPWELHHCGYVTVFPDTDKYRMYYRGLPIAGKDGSDDETTCYAESADGITWSKPNLGLFEVHGTRENNVILADAAPLSHNFSPFLDTRPDTPPEQRYKALGGTTESGLVAFISADGIHWEKFQEAPVITKGAFDSQNVAFWSESEQTYLCYFRTWTENNWGGFRTVSRATSKDFKTWTDATPMEFGDTPWEHLYTNQTAPYFRAPHIYLATAARFMPGRRVVSEAQAEALGLSKGYAGDCSDAVLMSSRGGNHYDRTFMEGFVRPGVGLENWVSRTNYPARGILQTGPAEMSMYVQHSYGQPTHHLVRYTMRLDGPASLHAGYAGGEMISKPITFTGEQLLLNMSTSAAGSLRVELQDESGTPIPDHTLDDCEELIGDAIEMPVHWKESSSLAPLIGKTIRLRIQLKDADLYALRFR